LLDDNGITTVELECLLAWFYPKGHPKRVAEQPMRELVMEAAGTLNARHIKVTKLTSAVMAVDDLRAAFAEVCDEAARVDTRVGMELIPPDPHCKTISNVLAWAGGFAN